MVQSVCLDRWQPWPGRPRSKRSQGTGRPASFAAGPRSAPTAALRAPSSPVDRAAVPWSWAGIESARGGRWARKGAGGTKEAPQIPTRSFLAGGGQLRLARSHVGVVLPAAWAAHEGSHGPAGERGRARNRSIDLRKKVEGGRAGEIKLKSVVHWLKPAQEGRLTTAHRRSRRAIIEGCCWLLDGRARAGS